MPVSAYFNCHGAVDPSRFELRHQVVRLKRTPQRLEPEITRIRRHLHPGSLIGAVRPEVLMCIDDAIHRVPPRETALPTYLCTAGLQQSRCESATDTRVSHRRTIVYSRIFGQGRTHPAPSSRSRTHPRPVRSWWTAPSICWDLICGSDR